MAELALGRRPRGWALEPALAPLIAAALAVVAWLAGWRGSDLPAALYRITLFHRHGLTLWDSQWYGGHWTLDYSVIFPPIAGILGVQVTEVACVAVAALSFDRLAVGAFGRRARIGSILFALGTLVQVSIGQLPFLMGEAFGLAALCVAMKGRWRWAAVLAACASLASPLAGAFVGLAAAAWLLAEWPSRRPQLIPFFGAAMIPVIGSSLLFPGQGAMPFPFKDWAFSGGIFALTALLLPARARVLRIGCVLYLAAFVLSFVLHTPVGGNIERLGEAFGPAVAVVALVALWPARRLLLPVVTVPLIILQWGPALSALSTNRVDPSTKASYFTPLVRYVESNDSPPARVEIVPTELHWEAAYAAPNVQLARGWERQLDTANNPLFYGKAPLTDATYRAWLLTNGVRFVALPDASLDYAGKAEALLVRQGVPGLLPVWHDAHWRVYEVSGSQGIVSGPAEPVSIEGGNVKLDVTAPGDVVVRVHYNANWSVVNGTACLEQGPQGWLLARGAAPGPLQLQLKLVGANPGNC
jgi:hypothetical protein